MELMRGIVRRFTGFGVEDSAPKRLCLSHRLSRPTEKVDAAFIEAVGLLGDLDKELSKFAMKVGKMYGQHFPELANIVSDTTLYAKVVKLMGNRTNAATLDFTEVLPEEIEIRLKVAAVVSMGSELNEVELNNIKGFCDQVLSLSESKAQLYDDLKINMNTIAPNLTALVVELFGAQLIAHAGGLLNLAKQPGSTIQILGAEKAFRRARKKKCATPKYGLIYNTSLIGKASPKNKGRMTRSLASKISLVTRHDAFGDAQDNSMGLESRAKLEEKLRSLEATEKIEKKKSDRNEVVKEDKA
ncbi:hypothetical protein MKX03_025115 [Papaver bracteatum]|nr:hypothetical protein MKX03_025115 [Papaver bracteatum]